MLSQRGKPLLVHDGHTFGIQYVRKDKKYWQCNLSRKFNCKARVTTTDTGEIIVTNNEHCHTEIRQHLRKDYQRNKVMMNALINLSNNRLAVENLKRHNVNNIANNLSNLQTMVAASQAAAAAAAVPLALQAAAATSSSNHHQNSAIGENAILNLEKRALLHMEDNKPHPNAMMPAVATASSAFHLNFNNNDNNNFNNNERENFSEINDRTRHINNDDEDDDDGEQVGLGSAEYCRKSNRSSPLHEGSIRLHQHLQQHNLNHNYDNELPLDCGIRSNLNKQEAETATKLNSLSNNIEFNANTGGASSTSTTATASALAATAAAAAMIYNQNWDCKKEDSSSSPSMEQTQCG